MSVENIQFEFNYASFGMTPYSGGEGTSSKLLKSIINKLNEEDFPSEKRIIDRHENRKNSIKRQLVVISNRFEKKGLRCFGKIALIKNKAPLLWSGKDVIEEIEKESNKRFIEITNYSIHFNNNSNPVIMYEYNHEGPRLSDIEYYFRQIAKDYRIARRIHTSIHLNTDYGKLDQEMKNVFAVTVKVNSLNSKRADWFKALKFLNDDSGYKDVRMELFYNKKKDQAGKYEKNIRGLDFARGLLTWLGKDRKNINSLDDLKMSYQSGSNEEIIDLDFLKNKVVSMVDVPLFDGRICRPADYKFNVGQEFNYYLSTGKTQKE